MSIGVKYPIFACATRKKECSSYVVCNLAIYLATERIYHHQTLFGNSIVRGAAHVMSI